MTNECAENGRERRERGTDRERERERERWGVGCGVWGEKMTGRKTSHSFLVLLYAKMDEP